MPAPTRYNRTARHFDATTLPKLLRAHLLPGTFSLADLGCGDGPLFAALHRGCVIDANSAVYAVDLEQERLDRISDRFPHVKTIESPAEAVPLPDGSLDFIISTMVMEHVPDEEQYLNEIRRLLKPGGRAYITTVFKKRWAWYFRKRDGESVLDVTHLREYTDLAQFKALLMRDNRFSRLRELETDQLWFPLLDPILFRLPVPSPWVLRMLRMAKVPIPGYFSLNVVVER